MIHTGASQFHPPGTFESKPPTQRKLHTTQAEAQT